MSEPREHSTARGVPSAAWIGAALIAGALASAALARFGAAGLAGVLLAAVVVTFGTTALRSPLAVLALALAALPLDIYGRLIEKPMAVTIYQVLLLAAMASWANARSRGSIAPLRLSPVDAGMLMLVFAGLWSLPHSLAPSATVFATVRLAFIWVFVLLIENVPRSRADVLVMLKVVAAIAAIHALAGIAQALVPGMSLGNVHLQGPAGAQVRRVAGFFDDPNYYSGMLGAGIMCAGALALYARRLKEVLIWSSSALLCAVAVLFTFSRTGWISIFVGVVVLALVAPRRIRWQVVGGGAALLVAAVLVIAVGAPGVFTERILSSGDVQGDQSVATRVYMAKSMARMISDNPVWGTGLAAFDQVYPYYREVGSSRTIAKPHQIPMGLVAETGIAGFLSLALLIGGLVALWWTRGARRLWAGEAAAVAGLACMSVQSLFQYYLFFEYLWLFVGLAVVAVRVGTVEEES